MIFSLFKNRCRSFLKKVFKPKPHEMDIKSSQNTVNQRPLIGEGANDTITWLHLSDFHFQAGVVSQWDSDIVINALLDDLKGLKARYSLSPDVIFVSGDITYSGKTEEYEISRTFFDDLLYVTNLTKKRLFIVPGNHDVFRNDISPGSKIIASSLKNSIILNKVLSNDFDRHLLLRGLDNYSTFIEGYFDDRTQFNNMGYFFVHNIDIAGHRVALLGLNSVWLSNSRSEDYGHLAIGEHQVRQALDASSDADLRIALLHHPFEWTHHFDRETCEALLVDGCDFILRGHLHQTGLLFHGTPDARAMMITAGSSFKSRQAHNAYNIVQLDLNRNQGTAYLRAWSNRSGGFWTKDVMTYRNVTDGIYNFLFQLSKF
jgi:predicted phosphodiesterase